MWCYDMARFDTMEQVLHMLERVMSGHVVEKDDAERLYRDLQPSWNRHHSVDTLALLDLSQSVQQEPHERRWQDAVHSWAFDAFTLPVLKPLTTLAMHIFASAGLLEELGMKPSNVEALVMAIEGRYMEVPYHNAFHAASVLHAMYMLLTRGGISEQLALDSQTMFACYIAAIAHDMGHLGLSNSFMVHTSHDIAITYNNESPWENFHASQTVRLMLHPEYGLSTHLDMGRLRHTVTKLIMATDIKHHFSHITAMANCRPADVLGYQTCMLQSVLKCADLCHLYQPYNIHMAWANRLQEEMYRQGEAEARHNIPISKFMDRNSTQTLISSQIKFIKNIMNPLVHQFVQRFPACQPIKEVTDNNLNKWSSILPPD